LPRRVLGVDPGSSATGWAVIESSGSRARMVEYGVVRPRGEGRAERLADLARRLDEVVVRLAPDAAAVESAFTARNPRSALSLAEARGVVLCVLGGRGLAVASYSPAQVKSSVVGTGRAEKQQVVFMIVRLLALAEDPPRDAADAAAVALTHLHIQRFPGTR
jgi:crossover junction endodeoxyribonuclease RuvC